MRHLPARLLTIPALALSAGLTLAVAGDSPVLRPDKLVILSTTDVKGDTSPCGCHTPKGGLARRASFADSVRTTYGQVVVVDNGGFFPEAGNQHDRVLFMMDAMKILGTEAVGLGDRDLKYGYAWLKSQLKRTQTPVVCANLIDKKTKKPAFAPSLVSQRSSRIKIGFFGLISDKVDLGPGRDSLIVEDPHEAARRTVAALRKQGATVVVLLSQLGKIESEDIVTAVDGLDAVIVGRNTPVLQKGRMIKNAALTYGGERGQYMGQTVLTIDASGRATAAESETYMLGPQVGERADMLTLVKSFEDAFNEKLRRQEKEQAAAQAAQVNGDEMKDHFIGSELCIRCHAEEGAQWKTTSHSIAWQTLVNAKKDATPDCIPCHVVGYNQPGGFVSFTATPSLSNVQCENCHGMGTGHDAFAAADRTVTEKVCITCHQGVNDPEFDWEKKLPKIAHDNLSGETIKNKKQKPDGSIMMKGHGAGN